MPHTPPVAATSPARASDAWVVVAVRVPPSWKAWLEEAATARGLSVAALVRQCIRALMIQRHDSSGSTSA